MASATWLQVQLTTASPIGDLTTEASSAPSSAGPLGIDLSVLRCAARFMAAPRSVGRRVSGELGFEAEQDGPNQRRRWPRLHRPRPNSAHVSRIGPAANFAAGGKLRARARNCLLRHCRQAHAVRVVPPARPWGDGGHNTNSRGRTNHGCCVVSGLCFSHRARKHSVRRRHGSSLLRASVSRWFTRFRWRR